MPTDEVGESDRGRKVALTTEGVQHLDVPPVLGRTQAPSTRPDTRYRANPAAGAR